MDALTRASILRDAANEKAELLCRVRSPRALQDTFIGDQRDARVMNGLRNSIPLGEIKHEVWSLQAAPLEDVRTTQAA